MDPIGQNLISIGDELAVLMDLTAKYKLEFNPDRLRLIEADFKAKSVAVTDQIKKCKDTVISGTMPQMQRAYYLKTVGEKARLCFVAKTAFHDAIVDRSIRQGLIARPDLSETEIRGIVSTNPNLINYMIMEAAGAATAEYAYAMERAAQINHLVRSIEEIALLMQDLSILVAEQSALLDHIEGTIETAVVHVKKGNDNIRAAVAVQKRTRKCWCLFVCIVLVLILVIVGTVTPIMLTRA